MRYHAALALLLAFPLCAQAPKARPRPQPPAAKATPQAQTAAGLGILRAVKVAGLRHFRDGDGSPASVLRLIGLELEKPVRTEDLERARDLSLIHI